MFDSPQLYPTQLFLPPRKYPYWKSPENAPHSLLYLSWGKRLFGKTPIPTTKHEGWAYMIVTRGSSILKIGKKTFPVATHSILVIPPDIPYGLTAENENTETEQFCWIWKKPPHPLPENHKNISWYRSTLNTAAIDRIGQLHVETRRQLEYDDSCVATALEGIRLQLDSEWARSLLLESSKTTNDTRFELAVRWMHEHLEETKPIEPLQEYLQVSSTTLKRLFLEKAKKNPQEFFHEIKFKKAYELLTSNETSVKSVALTLGYKHMNDFTRAFQRHFDFCPSTLLASKTQAAPPKTKK